MVNKEHEWSKTSQVFVEKFPYWSSPFAEANIDKFNVGDRVMNINSTKRQYVPFGLRGTVIGKTQKQVLVCFDQQFLHGHDINGHCEMYRGAILDPNHLLNVTRKFRKHLKEKNFEIVQKFTENNPDGLKVEQVPSTNVTEDAENKKFQVKQPKPMVQKQASTGYAQNSFYKAKSYQPVQAVEQPPVQQKQF